MGRERFDITVIGGGPGGYVAAIRAAKLGAKVALIEKSELGGTCLNKGCIPTKTLIHGAELYGNLQSASEWGISFSNLKFNMDGLLAKKNQVVKNLRQGIEKLIKANGISLIKGTGQLLTEKKILITRGEEKTEIESEKIILATGSVPAIPPIPGIENEGVITSDDALNLSQIPSDLVIIGAGVIGLEFASLYASLGANVVVIEAMAEILPMVDNEIVKRIIPLWKKRGVKIVKGAKVQKISPAEGKLTVAYSGSKGEEIIQCDNVLVATGRKPNLDKELLGDVKIEFEKRFITVNEKMQTNIENIFAIGDIVNSPMLAHVASTEGIIAAENAAGLLNMINYDVIPSCIYSTPEIANVGLTEEAARVEYEEIEVAKIPFSSNGRVLTLGENAGMLKIIMDKKSNKIVGAHIFGHLASELIAELTLAMENNLTVDDIAHTVHSHPSLSEIIQEGAHKLTGSPIHTI